MEEILGLLAKVRETLLHPTIQDGDKIDNLAFRYALVNLTRAMTLLENNAYEEKRHEQ